MANPLRPSLLFEYLATVVIRCHLLARHFVPPQIAMQTPRTEDRSAVRATPEGGIGDNDGRLWHKVVRHTKLMRIELFAHPDVALVVFR